MSQYVGSITIYMTSTPSGFQEGLLQPDSNQILTFRCVSNLRYNPKVTDKTGPKHSLLSNRQRQIHNRLFEICNDAREVMNTNHEKIMCWGIICFFLVWPIGIIILCIACCQDRKPSKQASKFK